eukprot:TRINITY_DN1210_c0_g2_i1.p2 TRINITY_DN1210_c0_g2~~TRINITY_DN1210_c0_g2_i1.p2  ORF type:complete len:416 (-),score=62.29 TRINITY_DN1210_c0_g2_i1:75-1322(-)
MREQFNYHLASHSRGADDRGQAKYTDIIRWVRTAMSSVPTTLLTKGLATNILCPEVLSGVPTEKENPDADEAFASYMADMAAEKAAKEKKKQDAIDLKKQKAKTKEEKAQQKKADAKQKAEIKLATALANKATAEARVKALEAEQNIRRLILEGKHAPPLAPTPPAPKLVIKKMNSRAPAAPTPPAPEAKKTGSVGSKRPRVSQTVTIGDNMSGPANITLNVTMPAFEMPLVETRLLRGILPKSPIQRPFVPQDEEEDLETYDAELVDCYPDWLDEQREDENRASFENEEEYINDFISRLYDAQESTRDFPPRTILQAGEPDDEELDAFDLCDEEEDLNRFNDDGEFIWDEPEEPHVVDCDDSGQVLDFSESAEDSAHCGDAEDSMLDFSESAEDTAHRGDAEDSMLDDSGCFEE